MNRETYEALKRVLEALRWEVEPNDLQNPKEVERDLAQLDSWIDEVSKEYAEGGEQDKIRIATPDEAEQNDRDRQY